MESWFVLWSCSVLKGYGIHLKFIVFTRVWNGKRCKNGVCGGPGGGLWEIEIYFLRQSLRVLRVEHIGICEKWQKLEMGGSIRVLELFLEWWQIESYFLRQSLRVLRVEQRDIMWKMAKVMLGWKNLVTFSVCWAAGKIWSLSVYVGQLEKFGNFRGMLGSWKILVTFGVC